MLDVAHATTPGRWDAVRLSSLAKKDHCLRQLTATDFFVRNTLIGTIRMIVRTWRAIAASQDVVDTYAAHLRRNTFREMRELHGHVGASLSVKPVGGKFEVLVMSYWDDMNAVRRFSGDKVSDLSEAVVKPSTQKLLDSYDPKVEYFEILVATGTAIENSGQQPA